MKEYHYHPEYKYFLCETDAYPCPMVPGEYLISANATVIEPPQTSIGFISVFDGNSWNIIKDNRGSYYCKDTLFCHHIEDPSCNVDNLTTIVPPLEEKSPSQIINWSDDKNDWVIEDLSKPEITDPSPIVDTNSLENMSVEQKLGLIGLTIDDLKALLLPNETHTHDPVDETPINDPVDETPINDPVDETL